MFMRKRLLAISVISAAMLVTGCGMRPAPKTVSNTGVDGAELYVGYQDGNFGKISNRKNQDGFHEGFVLNDYKPYGFNTGTYSVGAGGILWFHPYGSVEEYDIYQCKSKPLNTLTFNAIMIPMTLGLMGLVGGFCDQRHIFDHEGFDADAKDWTEDNVENRDTLISSYTSLVSISNENMSKIWNEKSKIQRNAKSEQSKFKERYEKIPSIKINKIDNTGLYRNEKLSQTIAIVKNTVPYQDFDYPHDFHKQLNKPFPCTSQQSCIAGIEAAKKSIKLEAVDAVNDMKKKSDVYLYEYIKELNKITSQVNLTYQEGEHIEHFRKKTIHYSVSTTTNVISSFDKYANGKIIIEKIDYKEIYPSFKNSNSDISISFNPETKAMKLSNKTNKFIQVNSVSLYYGDSIYTISDNKNSNYSTELSPESFKTFIISQGIVESEYKEVTKRKALDTNMSFGFAVKYTVGDNSRNKTLYRLDKANLYNLIKNF